MTAATTATNTTANSLFRLTSNQTRARFFSEWALVCSFAVLLCFSAITPTVTGAALSTALLQEAKAETLATELVSGEGIWVDPALLAALENKPKSVPVVVWFDRQLLGAGTSYRDRAKEYVGWTRSRLRAAAIHTLKQLSDESWSAAEADIKKLQRTKVLQDVHPLWIVNGFYANLSGKGLKKLQAVAGVKKIFLSLNSGGQKANGRPKYANKIADVKAAESEREIMHPWYSHQLMAVRAWQEFSFRGDGVLNVVHDFNFQYTAEVAANLYSNPGEIPGNGKDDDSNGLVDDVHGYDFNGNSDRIFFGNGMHGFYCVNVLCGKPLDGPPLGFGLAPESRWAGVIGRIEETVQWSVGQGADTYSMSFSIPGLKEGRSHWRKVLEHGSLCGIYFASGAGNFGQKGSRGFAPIPRQMRTPEDIPDVVFASTGVHRDLTETAFASKGPVMWELEHYQEGVVQKPEVCAFNHQIPKPSLDGSHQPGDFVNGNSLAGPMLCGTIAILLSADPELLPWDVMEILTSTATDIAEPGVDFATGHGLINVYRAVKETLRRKALRLGQDPAPFSGRSDGDFFDVGVFRQWVKEADGVKNLRLHW